MTQMSESENEKNYIDIEQDLRKRYRKNLWCRFTKAIREYDLVQEGDRIAVCISGGKDSMLMAKLFQELKRHNKFEFDVKFLVMDPGYKTENRQLIEHNAKRLNIPLNILSLIFLTPYTTSKIHRAICVPECGVDISTAWQRSWAAIRSHWDTTMMM